MDRLKAQAAKLWQLLFAQDTLATYQKAITLTIEILKESALLLWLTLCLVLVLFEWFYKNATQAGSSMRNWLNRQQDEDSSPDKIATGLGQALLAAGQNSLAYTLTQAKEQLGLPAETPPPVLASAAPSAAPPAVPPAPPAEPPAPTATPTVTPPTKSAD